MVWFNWNQKQYHIFIFTFHFQRRTLLYAVTLKRLGPRSVLSPGAKLCTSIDKETQTWALIKAFVISNREQNIRYKNVYITVNILHIVTWITSDTTEGTITRRSLALEDGYMPKLKKHAFFVTYIWYCIISWHCFFFHIILNFIIEY